MMLGGMGILWILVFLGAVFLFPESSQEKENDNADSHASVIDVLKMKYAKGEIGKNEFERKKRELL